MASKATLLLDVGGQGCRALVADAEARLILAADRHVPTIESGNRIEQDADALAIALAELAAQAVSDIHARGASVTRATLAVKRGDITCWDRHTGQALAAAISWRDRRGLTEMWSLAEQAGEVKRRTGLRFSPYGGASKLGWCLKEVRAVRDAARAGSLCFGPLGSFLTNRLVEDQPPRVDDTLAQRTLLWSRETFDWDQWLLERFGLPREPLPDVVASRSNFGCLTAVPGSPRLELLVGDQNALAFLDGEPDPDTLYINLGTGAFLVRPVITPVETDLFQLSLLDRHNKGRWALEGSVHGSASAIAWLEHKSDREIPHGLFSGLRQRVGTPPLFINTIDGLGSPWWQPGPEAGFVGDHTCSLDARLLAVLESIAFLIRANIEAMSDLVGPPKRVMLSGGLSRADDLCGLIADTLQSDLLRLRNAEGTAFGTWCMLHQRPLPDQAFDFIPHGENDALQARYQKWRQRIEAETSV